MDTQKLLQVQSVAKTYGKGENQTDALNGISFDVLEGEFLGIMGASGSGKTTLLNCIATMTRPSSGKILFQTKDIGAFAGSELSTYRSRCLGYLFQEFELLDNMTARENIILPLSIQGVSVNSAEPQLMKLAKKLDILEVLDKFPSQMSGGQKQRVAAARSLISDPKIVIADEPTGALDTKNAKILMDKLSSINREQRNSIILVTHDPNVASYCSRILFIRDGLLFHELRKVSGTETVDAFYERIVTVLAQLGGGSSHVL